MKFKVGDNVRFVTTEPDYGARWIDGVLTVEYVHDDGDVECSYPDANYRTYSQCVNQNDLEHI